MKRISTFLLALVFVSLNSLNAQTYQYFFNNSLAEDGGVGPTLTDELTCAAASAGYSTQVINTAAGNCGSTAKTTFDFNVGEGLQFDNTTDLIGGSYTIHMLFKFNTLSGSQRVLDFQNGASDQGIYTDNDCLRIHPAGTLIGTCPNMVAGQFILFTITRDGGTELVTTYLDGVPFETYTDNTSLYFPTTTTTPIRFFLDDACEDAAGSIKYLSLTNGVVLDATQVATFFTSLCGSVLPLHLGNFAANKQNSTVVLSWNAVSEPTTSHFELERSESGSTFTKLSDIPVSGSSSTKYTYTDKKPLSGLGYYRIKIVDLDGSFKYSTTLKITFSGQQKFEVYPNPVKSVINITGIKDGGRIKLLNLEGKELMQKVVPGGSITWDLSKYPRGVYYIQYYDGQKLLNKKVVKN